MIGLNNFDRSAWESDGVSVGQLEMWKRCSGRREVSAAEHSFRSNVCWSSSHRSEVQMTKAGTLRIDKDQRNRCLVYWLWCYNSVTTVKTTELDYRLYAYVNYISIELLQKITKGDRSIKSSPRWPHLALADKVLKAAVFTRLSYIKRKIHVVNQHANLSRKTECWIKRTKQPL